MLLAVRNEIDALTIFPYWQGRTLTPSDVPDQTIVQLFRDTRDRVLELVAGQLTEQLGPQQPLYSDVVHFLRLRPVRYRFSWTQPAEQ